jgi:hypothetical protein
MRGFVLSVASGRAVSCVDLTRFATMFQDVAIRGYGYFDRNISTETMTAHANTRRRVRDSCDNKNDRSRDLADPTGTLNSYAVVGEKTRSSPREDGRDRSRYSRPTPRRGNVFEKSLTSFQPS